ncbi:MAG: M23 family metallopeptidase [Patescibacteria group bacterium]
MKNLLMKIIILSIIIFILFLMTKSENSILIQEATTKPTSIKSVMVSPEIILPGDPIMITVTATSSPNRISFDGRDLPILSFEGKSSVFVPIDFNEKDLEHEVEVTLSNGMVIVEPVTFTLREKIERPLGIPEKLGGNTPAAEKALINNLAKENAILNSVKSEQKQLWTEKFGLPLQSIFITDDYGYDRKTVNSTIVHKGTDFRAEEGTEVKALNNGVVRIARMFTVYGNTVVIDHGFGIQSFYMHMSKLDIKEGDIVKTGQILGLSGKTGYAEAAHLHISIKINGISIDPATFLRFFTVI